MKQMTESRINRVCFSWISASTWSFQLACIPKPQCTLPAIAMRSCRLPISFLVSLHGLAVVYSRALQAKWFHWACITRKPGRKIRAAERTLRLCRCGKSRGCFANAFEIWNELVQLGELQAVINHRLRAGHAQDRRRPFSTWSGSAPSAPDGRDCPMCVTPAISKITRLLARTDQFINLLFPVVRIPARNECCL